MSSFSINGGIGTIFQKGEIQNLRAVGVWTVIDLADQSLTTEIAAFIPDALVSLKLNPKEAQTRTLAIFDNVEVTVFTNPNYGNMTDVAMRGDFYIDVYIFNNLYILKGA